MPLTDTAVRQARPKEKVYKLRDERGLLLMVRPTGAKWWRLRYKFQGKENMLGLGVYPDVSLSMARDRRDAARRMIADGKDPSAERQAERDALKLAHSATIEKVARHYLAGLARKVRRGKGSIKTYKKAKWMLETFIFPKLGDKPIGDITASELLVELKKIEAKGLNETARRTKQRCGKVFRHAIGLGHAVRDLTPDLRGLLEAPDVEHHAALTDPRQIGTLLLDIDNYDSRFITRCALRFEPLVFLPGIAAPRVAKSIPIAPPAPGILKTVPDIDPVIVARTSRSVPSVESNRSRGGEGGQQHHFCSTSRGYPPWTSPVTVVVCVIERCPGRSGGGKPQSMLHGGFASCSGVMPAVRGVLSASA
jgi:hypothetical protein